MKGVFIAGTDTDIGKTFFSKLLCYGLSQKRKVTYFKPVQAGHPTDTDSLKNTLGVSIDYHKPVYELKMPASPNRAADAESISIDTDLIAHQTWNENFYVVEGAGGLLVPLNDTEKVIDLSLKLEVPTLLVTSTRLGTINHTLLSVEAMKARGVPCLGLILNGPEDPGLKELLEKETGLSVLLEVPRLEDSLESFETFYQESNKFQKIENAVFDSSDLKSVSPESLESLDKQHVWHPFTQHGIVKNHPLVSRGSGSYLHLNEGPVLDASDSFVRSTCARNESCRSKTF